MLNLNNPKTIKKLREQIDEIDKKLLKILSERFRVTQRVGEYKKRHKLPALDKKREKEIFQKRELLAKNFQSRIGKESGYCNCFCPHKRYGKGNKRNNTLRKKGCFTYRLNLNKSGAG